MMNLSTLELVLCLFLVLQANGSCLGYDSDVSKLAAQYASCSSVTTDYLHQIREWNYTYCLNAQPEKRFIKEVSLVQRRDKNLLALSLYDQERDLIVLSFRATVCGSGNANGKTDLNAQLKLYQEWGCRFGLCRMHAGFLNSYNLMQQQLREKVTSLTSKHPSARVMVTGVSLGGALAAVASYDLKMYLKTQIINPQFLFYTFGQPRIGNYYLIREMNRELNIFRVVDAADPVPHLPPRKWVQSSLVYYHPGIEVYYQDEDSSSFALCPGDNEKCSLKRKGLFEACNHLYYPLMNFQGKDCQLKNSRVNFDITEMESLKQDEQIVAFMMHECKLTCEHMDSMMCPYYRIPEIHCEPLQQKSGLLWSMMSFITPKQQLQKIQENLEGSTTFKKVCTVCESFTKRHIRKVPLSNRQ